jgi:transcriptional regulator with XRE-family HTH domain
MQSNFPTYVELLERQDQDRAAFGRMLLNWRRRNGWTQYTACSWAEQAGFETISYGNLSVIEQGKAGELRQKAFWQLSELNRRIAARQWGTVKDPDLQEKLEPAIPLGDADCPVWGPVEFWACYSGLREVPEDFRTTPAPTIGQRKATELSSKWRQHLRRVVEECDLDPSDAMEGLATEAGAEHRKRFYAVLTGFGDYRPEELSALWLEGDTYLPRQWLEQWEQTVRRRRRRNGSRRKPTSV